MKRREFLALVGGASVASSLAARAQQPAMPAVGFLSYSSSVEKEYLAGFMRGLTEAGYVEGRNVKIEYRFADGQFDRLSPLAADLVRQHVAVIVPLGNVAARAAIGATSTIPIVFHTADDPIAVGLVSYQNRGTDNRTGVSEMGGTLPTKRLELLHEVVPSANTIGVLVNPHNGNARSDVETLQVAARAIGLQIATVEAVGETGFERAFLTLVSMHVGALLVSPDAVFQGQHDRLVNLAAFHGIPTVYPTRLFVDAGGLISYGSSFPDGYRQTASYVGRILKGEKPADLPIQRPSKFEFVINHKTAKTLGLTIPESVLLRADKVIE